jgi:hypothetical protein
MRTEHVCRPMEPQCLCSMNQLEPNAECPFHGGATIHRCECGRFVKTDAFNERAEVHAYLSRLLTSCAPECEPEPDLLDLVTQIDNLISGLRR